MKLQRAPQPALRPFIRSVWLVDETARSKPAGIARERVLPTGEMHVAFRLSEQPVRVFTGALDMTGQTHGTAVVSGARAAHYVKDVSGSSCSIGAQLQPGAALPLFGVTASELAGHHVQLCDLWGHAAASQRDRLMEERDPARRLDLYESLLAARLPRVHGLHPAVALAIERFSHSANVREVVAESGYSHRRFTGLFHEALGLTPKLYCRLQRFQGVLARLAAHPHSAWIELALDCGYSDQSHFNREFSEFAGITPGEYRRISPANPNHVTIQQATR